MQLKIGSQFSGFVKDLASDGRGVVVHPSGRTFFAPGVWLGERGEFRITGLKGRIGFAEPVQLEAASLHPGRVAPACAYQGFGAHQCGGCPWQFMAYERQLQAKQERVQQQLHRLGCAQALRPILPSPQTLAYRNRAQFKTDGTRLGYVAAQSNQLVDIESCPILTEPNVETLTHLRATLPNADWQPLRRQRWTTLDIDENTPAEAVSVNARLPFQQGNTAQNARLRTWLAEHLAPIVEDCPVLELFCGSGNLTEVIAAAGASEIFAVEVVEAALTQLRTKNLPGVIPLACDLFSDTEAERLLPYVKKAEVLVLDPPREGLKVSAPLFVKKSALRRVYYISCDLATFTRDLALFMAQGFSVKEVQPLDMFPHTPHIELMAELQR